MKKYFSFLFQTRAHRVKRAHMRQVRINDFFHQVRSNTSAMIGVYTILFFLLVAIIGPFFIHFDVSQTGASVDDTWLAPSWQHLLGTDHLGRDLLAFLITGARSSLAVAFFATIISMLIGTTIGIVSGYCGGWLDTLLMRITDFVLCIPWLPLCMVLASFLGTSLLNIILVIGLTGWAGSARLVRAQTLSVKEMTYVERTVSIGSKNWHIMFLHILPNVFPIVFANTVLDAAGAITTETTLSFLGLGDPTRPSWGMILYYAEANNAVSRGAWWYFLPAGICVILVVLGFTLMGYAFDEILNPKLKER